MLAALLALLVGAAPAHAAPGDLDTSFGTGGVARLGQLYPAAAFEADGGLTVIGADADEASGRVGMRVEHLSADGTVLWRRHDQTAPALEEVAAGADGSMAGFRTGMDFGSAQLVRYGANGERDRSFGGAGVVALDFEAQGVVVQDDGRIIVAGPDVRGLKVERYTVDGRLDPTWDGDGRWESSEARLFFLGGLALDRDGTLVLVGGDTEMAVLRLSPGGQPDPSFSGDGLALPVRWVHPSPVRDKVWVTPQRDGYLIGGPRQYVRVTRDGDLDPDFVSDVDASLEVQPGVDGRTVVHTPWYGRVTRFQRLNPDGSLDPEFGLREHDVDPDFTVPLRDGSTALVQRGGGRTEVRRLLGGGAPPPPVRVVVTEFPALGVYEGDTGAKVVQATFGLARAWPEDVSFRVVSVDGAATAGTDYEAVDELVTIPAGERYATVPVTILGDTVYEWDDDFTLVATPVTPNVRVLAYGKGTVSLWQDLADVDPTPTPTPTATPSATATAEPTVTPEPTATPTPEPTATAEPTATPTPEPSASPTPTPLPASSATPTPFVAPAPAPRADIAGALRALKLPALAAKGGAATFTVRPSATLAPTALTFSLRSRARKPVVYGRATAPAAAGSRHVTLRLNAAGKRALKQAKALRVEVVIGAGGSTRTVAAKLTRR